MDIKAPAYPSLANKIMAELNCQTCGGPFTSHEDENPLYLRHVCLHEPCQEAKTFVFCMPCFLKHNKEVHGR